MRDAGLLALFLVMLVPSATRPWLGLLIWVCFDYMNPHRACYSYALLSVPFSMIIALWTMGSLVISREPKRIIWTREITFLALFVLWMNVTMLFAMNPESARWEWDRAMKIQLMIFATLVAVKTLAHLNALIWTIVVSIGIYGVKGGLFSIRAGGVYRVRGPEFTFIEDNNDLALALVAVLPLMRYLQLRTERKWVRWGLGVAMALTTLSVIASYSRAGMLALAAVIILMILKSRRRLVFSLLLIVSVVAILNFMPGEWFDRMHSISEYQQDNSAKGRLNAWAFAWNIALQRPLTGGGFRVFTPGFFREYAPDPEDYHEAHSIFLKILAEHGFPALTFFMLMAVCTWWSANWMRRQARHSDQLRWAADLASMGQVAMAGYAVGGAFSNLAYFGLPYHLMLTIVIGKYLLKQELAGTIHDGTRSGADSDTAEPGRIPSYA